MIPMTPNNLYASFKLTSPYDGLRLILAYPIHCKGKHTWNWKVGAVGCCWYLFDQPVLMDGPKPLMIVSGIHHRLGGRVSKLFSTSKSIHWEWMGPQCYGKLEIHKEKSLLIVEVLLVIPGDNDSCCCRCWYAEKAKHLEVCSHSNILVFSGRHFHKTGGGLTHVLMINSH